MKLKTKILMIAFYSMLMSIFLEGAESTVAWTVAFIFLIVHFLFDGVAGITVESEIKKGK